MSQPATKDIVSQIPLLTTNAGPHSDDESWRTRLKEEYAALIAYVKLNKSNQNDWFRLESNPDGTRWKGHCRYIHDMEKYEFELKFELPAAYPAAPIELQLPELDGKTSKMYRGGRICLDIHFAPYWSKNVPKFGIAHSLALGLSPWLAAEIPYLAENGIVQPSKT